MLKILFCHWLVLILVAGASNASARSCAEWLRANAFQSKEERAKVWEDRAFQAHQGGNRNAEVYSILRYSMLKQKGATQLNQLASELEMFSASQEMSRGNRILVSLKHLLAMMGLTKLAQKQVFGIEKNWRDRIGQTLRPLGLTAIFTFAPIFQKNIDFRAYEDVFVRKWYAFWFKQGSLIQPIFERFAKADGNSLESATTDFNLKIHDLARELAKSKARKTWSVARLLRPWVLAASIVFSTAATPYELTRSTILAHAPYGYQDYSDLQFLADAKSQLGDIAAGRTLIAYSRQTFSIVDDRPDPPFAVEGLRTLKSDRVEVRPIDTITDLNFSDLNTFDTVIILAHGWPDFMTVGLTNPEAVKMKEGANLIFFSCLVGQKGGGLPQEEWTRLADAMLDGGRAVASTQNISSRIEPDEAGGVTKVKLIRGWVDYYTQKLIEASGTNVIDAVYTNVRFLPHEFHWAPKGIRVFDSKTKQTYFFKSMPEAPPAELPDQRLE